MAATVVASLMTNFGIEVMSPHGPTAVMKRMLRLSLVAPETVPPEAIA
jgi:hypothetical protein